jgi:hypothetical protein
MMLSPRDRERLSSLDDITGQIRHAHRLVEQFAASPKEAEQLGSTIRRNCSRLKLMCTTAGFDRLAQISAGLEVSARRGTSHVMKARALREGVGSLTRQVDVERRQIKTAAQREADSSD